MGAGLLANAVCLREIFHQIRRFREQARSHIGIVSCLVGLGLPVATFCSKLRTSSFAATLDQQTGQH